MRERGATLVETIIVIAIVGVLAAFIAPILQTAVSSYDQTTRNVEVLTKMRYAMERMAREIRSIRRDPKNTARNDISAMSASKFEFCTTEGNRVTIDAGAVAGEVRIGYTAATLQATCPVSAATTYTLTDAVTSFGFQYCQNNGVSCATSSGVLVNELNADFVDITLTLTGTGTVAYPSTMRVNLRAP